MAWCECGTSHVFQDFLKDNNLTINVLKRLLDRGKLVGKTKRENEHGRSVQINRVRYQSTLV